MPVGAFTSDLRFDRWPGWPLAVATKVERLDDTQGAPQWTASVLAGLARRGRIEVTADRPMHTHPLYPLLNLAFAALDFARRPFAPTAQMICVLGRAETPAGEPTRPQ